MRRLPLIRRWGIRVTVAAVLAAGGVLSAGAIAGGFSFDPTNTKPTSTKDHPDGGKNTGRDETTTGSSGIDNTPPPATTAPPTTTTDPVGDFIANQAAVVADARATKSKAAASARAQIEAVEPLVMWICLFAFVHLDNKGDLSPALKPLGKFCIAGLVVLAGLYATADDPPSANVLEVALPTFATAPGRLGCPKRVSALKCLALNAAYARFRTALQATATAAAGMGLTMERLSGALAAQAVAATQIQSAAEKAYAGQLAAAQTAQAAAGRTFASVLRANKLDVRMEARARQNLLARLGSPNGLPASVVSTLITSGLTKDAADLSKTLRTVVAGKPAPPTLATTLAKPASTAALVELSKQLTVYEAAALVRALASQRAITGSTRDSLLDDLRETITAGSAAAREAALGRFDLDAGGVNGPAGALLNAAGRALS